MQRRVGDHVGAGVVKHQITLGATGGHPAMLDVGKLLAARLLIQAGWGGGKSWLLRRLLEQSLAEQQRR